MREFAGEKLSDTVLSICQLINKPQYLPKIPTRSELSSVYDDRFCDCQPYNYLISYDHGRLRKDNEGQSKGGFMRKWFMNVRQNFINFIVVNN